MQRTPRIALFAIGLLVGSIAAACSSASPGSYGNGGGGGGSGGGGSGGFPGGGDGGQQIGSLGGGEGGAIPDAGFSADAFWSQDPPPMYCGPAGGGTPPTPPGGTPDCPDDKNREGCPCPTTGQTAACWPGLRINRGLGICKDGMTTCVQQGESNKAWGPCMGYVLPQPGVTSGKEACKCFSSGQWAIDNVVPCIADYGGGQVYATSSYIDASGTVQCPANAPMTPPPAPQPGTTWSTNSLTVDCAGHFKLCYTIKAGNVSSPQPGDCVVTQACTEADYVTANQLQKFPDLPAWTSTDTACGAAFENTGGYGEMSVIGQSVRCDKVDDGSGNPFVFQRDGYCPLACDTNPSGPGCMGCTNGGSGMF
jgi:hypothetical protein